MITKIEARNYKCFKFLSMDLERFQILVGPNASGKSTFLDVIQFVSDFVTQGNPQDPVFQRAPTYQDVLWKKSGNGFEIAIEARIPDGLMHLVPKHADCRYEFIIQSIDGELQIGGENLWLIPPVRNPAARQIDMFPRDEIAAMPLMHERGGNGWKKIGSKVRKTGNDIYYKEPHYKEKSYDPVFKLGPRKSLLANLPEDETKFTISSWFKNLISHSVKKVVLSSDVIRKPSPPGKAKKFLPDGSNLPWVINNLQTHGKNRYNDWLHHVRTVFPDIRSIDTIERPEDRHRYLVVDYGNKLKLPSWLVSDGTLRFLALTVLSYLDDLEGIYLIEEPENGIHPRAIEALYHSLSSVYGAQVLLASHSPVFLSCAEPYQLLCFAKNDAGASDVSSGKHHPKLKNWRGETSLGNLFASGILG